MTKCKDASVAIDVIGVAILIGISSLAYFAGVAPALQAVQVAAQERIELAKHYADAELLERSIRTSAAALDQIERASAPASSAQGGTALDRIGRISSLAADAGVSVTDLSPKAEQPGTRFNRTPITVAGQGAAPAFIDLIARLHAEFPDTQVTSLTITATPDVPASPAGFNAELVWYTVAKVAGQADRSVGAVESGGAASGASSQR